MENKKSGFTRFLENVKIISTEQETNQPATAGSATEFVYKQKPTIDTTIETNFPIPPPVLDNSEMDKQFLDHLMGFMEKKNQPGDDYFEFANLLHDMFEEDKSISEQTLFKFAYKSFKQKNITSEQLIKSANQYISDFEQHKVEFDNHIQQESNDTVIAKKKNNDELTAKNAENAKKIDELNKQIQMIQTESTSNSQKITQNLQEITVASQNIETKKSKFEKNTLIVINKIKGDIQKIQNYLS